MLGSSSRTIDKIAMKSGPLSYNRNVLTEEDKQWISQQLEKVETILPAEFHKWASPVELRQSSHAAALRALDAEVESPRSCPRSLLD